YRRWRTKQDLVVDTISDLNRAEAAPPDTGSVEGDLREMMHQMVALIGGPTGAATLSLLSTMPHQPALAEAFRNGALEVWRHAYDAISQTPEQRGEASE